MPLFKYKALDKNAQIIEDKIEIESEYEAITEINKKGYQLIEIKLVNSFVASLSRKKVSKKELGYFTKQLSYLISTGIPLHRGVEVIGEQTKNTYFKSVIYSLINDIKEGIPLSQACYKHPRVFPESMIFQIKAAESGGFMQEALMNIANDFERDASFNKQVKGAMMYPAMVLVVAVGIVYFMLAYVVPKMTATFTSFDAELPQITQIVMFASDIAKGYWYVFILFVGASIYLFNYFILKDESRRLKFDELILKIPVIGDLFLNINMASMTRVMASLLSSGVPMDDVLDNVRNVISNKYISLQVQKVRSEVVEQGISFSRAIEEKKVFPRLLVQIAKVGEESGSLEEVLNNLSEKMEEDVTELLKTTTSLINPLLMIFIGGIVAVIVVALYLPMMSLIDQM